MRKKELLLGMLAMATISLCACGSGTESAEKNTTTKVVEQQNSSTTADTTNEQVTTEEVTTEQATTEEETTTAPKIVQCQDIQDTTEVDIFTLEGIDGPKPIEFSFGVSDVFYHTVPAVCKWDKEAKAFFFQLLCLNISKTFFITIIICHISCIHIHSKIFIILVITIIFSKKGFRFLIPFTYSWHSMVKNI